MNSEVGLFYHLDDFNLNINSTLKMGLLYQELFLKLSIFIIFQYYCLSKFTKILISSAVNAWS